MLKIVLKILQRGSSLILITVKQWPLLKLLLSTICSLQDWNCCLLTISKLMQWCYYLMICESVNQDSCQELWFSSRFSQWWQWYDVNCNFPSTCYFALIAIAFAPFTRFNNKPLFQNFFLPSYSLGLHAALSGGHGYWAVGRWISVTVYLQTLRSLLCSLLK